MASARRPRGRFLVGGLLATLVAFGLVVPPPRVEAWVAGQYNAAQESLLFSLTNQARAAAGVAPCRLSTTLRSLARWRSKDMADRDYFSHEIPPAGQMVFAEMDRRGFQYVLAGENIGWDNAPDDQATQYIQQMFMNSPGHRANILYKKWDTMAVGAFKGTDGRILYTVLFLQSVKPRKATTQPGSHAGGLAIDSTGLG